MTHPDVWHDLIHTCDMTSFMRVTWLHAYVWHDSFLRVALLIHMCDMTPFLCVTWLLLIYDMVSCILGTWPIRIFEAYVHTWLLPNCMYTHIQKYKNVTQSLMSQTVSHRNFLIYDMVSFIWGDMTQSYVWYDSFMRATWLIPMCSTHTCRHSFACAHYNRNITPFLHATSWLISISDMTHSYVWLHSTHCNCTNRTVPIQLGTHPHS